MIKRVQASLKMAEECQSKLTPEVLELEGMSGVKGRHFFNAMCSFPGTRYLELGVWCGSTFVSALYGNQETLDAAFAADNFSQFGNKEKVFRKNTERYLSDVQFQFVNQDCFTLDLNTMPGPFNVYFYDADHSFEAQEKAFTYFNPVLAKRFVAIVDDWHNKPTVDGTRSAFEKLGYKIEFETVAKGRMADWWHGLFVAVVRK